MAEWLKAHKTVYPFHYNKDYNFRVRFLLHSETVYPFHYNKDYNLILSF